jgi:hypothetical protein
MSDATITIDAKATAAIEEFGKVARAAKGVTKAVKDSGPAVGSIEEALGKAGQKLTGMVAPLGLFSLGAAAVTAIFDRWNERLTEGLRLQKEHTQALMKTAGQTGGSIGRARKLITGMESALSEEQRGEAAGAYLQQAPQATDEEAKAIVRQAEIVNAAGLSTTSFAKGAALLRPLGQEGADISARVLAEGGGQADKILEVLGTIASRLGGEQAKAAVPTLLASAQVNGGTDLMASMLDRFLSQGRQGVFADTVRDQGVSLAPELATRRTLAQVQQLTRPVAPGTPTPSTLAILERQQSADAEASAFKIMSRAQNARDEDERKKTAASSLRREGRRLAIEEAMPWNPSLVNAGLSLIPGSGGNWLGFDPGNRRQELNDQLLGQAADALEDLNRKVQRRPAMGTQGEP